MAWTLDQWLEAGRTVRRVYLDVLGRDILADPDALSNWLCHMREGGHDEAWLRQVFMESDEYRSQHGSTPVPAPVPVPTPDPGPSRPSPGPSGLVRVTNEDDGEIEPRQYAYWPCAWVQPQAIFVFAGLKRDGQVHFYRVEGSRVVPLGPLLTQYPSNGEGWYWDASGWVCLIQGPRLLRASPFSGMAEVLGDISTSHPGCELKQAHSSDDGRVHSATVVRRVESGAYPAIGTIVFFSDRAPYYTAAEGALDESHLSADGRWLVIEENNNNRMVLLSSGATAQLTNRDGALSHIDCGPTFMVGEDDQHEPGACVRWDFTRPFTPENRQLLYSSGVWGGQGMGHVSVQAGRCLLSTATALLLVPLDGSKAIETVQLHNMVGDKGNYDLQVKANLSRDGSAYCFMSNMGGPRQDVYVGRL